MNQLDTVVVKVLGPPYFEYDKWWVRVLGDDGYSANPRKSTLMFDTLEEAESVKKGYTYLS